MYNILQILHLVIYWS